MNEDPCPELRRRICPFISSGEVIVRCKGIQCNACRPVPVDEGTVWVCSVSGRRPWAMESCHKEQ